MMEGNETADQLAKDGGGHMAAAEAVQKAVDDIILQFSSCSGRGMGMSEMNEFQQQRIRGSVSARSGKVEITFQSIAMAQV